MSKRAYFSRYSFIIKKLQVNPYTSYVALQQFIEQQAGYLQLRDEDLNLKFSKRTLQRDIKEIRQHIGVDIVYSSKNKGYFIAESKGGNNNFHRMIEAFDLHNSLNMVQDVSPFVQLENRKPQGTENLYGLLHAIKNKLQIIFTYHKFDEEELSKRQADPYFLKEFKNRWYLQAKEGKEGVVKTFALDRMSNLEITNIRFTLPNHYNISEVFKYCFGTISPSDAKPQDIILSFTPLQGKYIKSLPLHHSQQIILDTNSELQIKLHLYITYDLEMELLSYSSDMKVLKPKSLANRLKDYHKKAYQQYQ